MWSRAIRRAASWLHASRCKIELYSIPAISHLYTVCGMRDPVSNCPGAYYQSVVSALGMTRRSSTITDPQFTCPRCESCCVPYFRAHATTCGRMSGAAESCHCFRFRDLVAGGFLELGTYTAMSYSTWVVIGPLISSSEQLTFDSVHSILAAVESSSDD